MQLECCREIHDDANIRSDLTSPLDTHKVMIILQRVDPSRAYSKLTCGVTCIILEFLVSSTIPPPVMQQRAHNLAW